MPQQVSIDGGIIVGAKRSTTNPVINRNHYPLGKSIFSNPVPAKEAASVHGTLVKRDTETAGSLMYNWTLPSPPRREIDHGRNFMKLNKMAVTAKASDCQQVTQFRQENDARIVSRPGDVLKLKNQVPVNLDPNQVYGTASPEPNATMTKLINYGYEKDWVNEQLQRERKMKKKEDQKAALRQSATSYGQRQRDATLTLPSIGSR
eukprot:EG_transcript_22018